VDDHEYIDLRKIIIKELLRIGFQSAMQESEKSAFYK
jgi:hypothetical protein